MRRFPGVVVLAVSALVSTLALAACESSGSSSSSGDSGASPAAHSRGAHADDPRPERFRIVPDDYHVPYAGTAEDGRRFFLSQELFDPGGSAYVGLFLWKADGTFDRVEVDAVTRPPGVPPGQAAPAGAKGLVAQKLAELGDYTLEPIEVEPFISTVDGVPFGWHVGRYDDGEWFVNVMPGDFICYYAPWDGVDYDT